MKRILASALLLAVLAVFAAPVSVEQARTAVGHWLKADPALGCRLGTSVSGVRTCTPTNGVSFHVVQLAGGGFVVTSADTRIGPVVAFSAAADLAERSDNPLWSLLKGDLAARARQLAEKGAGLQSVGPSGASAKSPAEARWAKLLDGAALQSAASLSDPRVDPLVKSRWGQAQNSIYSNRGGLCYNYYTPNNSPCGCVATALAQLMRYHRYPAAPKTVASRTCAVDGVQGTRTMMGGPYAYDDMPLVPEASTAVSWYAGGCTEAQRQAIGRLTYDCAVALQADFGEYVTGAGGAAAHGPLTHVFGYATAHTTTAGLGGAAYRDRILRTNLDAGCPVLLGVDGPSGGHEVIADGYGYSDGILYTHLNLGWSGEDDAWYALPDIDLAEPFDTLSHAVFNVFTQDVGEIVSGRVVGPSGSPVEGATVTIESGGTVVSTKTTNVRGIFAFVVPAPSSGLEGRSYVVRASWGAVGATPQMVSVMKTADSQVTLHVGSYSYNSLAGTPTCGNVLCDDLVLSGMPVVEPPAFSPKGCYFYPATNVALTCATPGATVRYTLDGTDPTEASAVYGGPVGLTGTAEVRARAFKDGCAASPVVSAVYTYAPPGDYFQAPISIQGGLGSQAVVDFGRYGVESGEPFHTLQDGARAYEFHTVWFIWTAPASGSASFTTRCGAAFTRYPTAVAVYDGEDLATATRLAMSKDYQSSGDYSTTVACEVEKGRAYRVVGVCMYDVRSVSGATFTLSWTAAVPPPTLTSTTEVPVPYDWLDLNFPAPSARTEAAYEALALEDSDGDGYANWAEYLCGTDPAQTADRPRCAIRMDGGAPSVTHNVVVPDAAAAQGWRAALKGSADMVEWSETPDPARAPRFFKVVVERR